MLSLSTYVSFINAFLLAIAGRDITSTSPMAGLYVSSVSLLAAPALTLLSA